MARHFLVDYTTEREKIMAVKIYPKKSSKKISKNFAAYEFDCPCAKCDVTPIDEDFVVNVLQKIRDKFGKPMYTNAYRCPAHNAEVKNASPTSRHMEGTAFDVSIPGVDPLEIAKEAERMGVKGIGYYKKDGFVHLDSRTTKSYWSGHEQTKVDTFLDSSDAKLNNLLDELEALVRKYR